jgi:glc operon protein GlcG
MQTTRMTFVLAAVLGLLSTVASSQAPTDAGKSGEAGKTSKPTPKGQLRPMTLEIAKQLVAAARKGSCSPPAGACTGAFAVADDAGVVIYLEAIDGVLAGAPDLAIRKAQTSAMWRRPTAEFQDAVNNKTNTSYADGTFQFMTTSPGGITIVKDGRVVGALGSGGTGSTAANKQIAETVLAEAAKVFGPQ